MATFDEYDITFEYPDGWELTVEGDASERTVTLQSPDTAFWLLNVYAEHISPLALVNQASAAFEDEYDDAEVEPFSAEILEFDTDGRDVDFSSLDLMGHARIESFSTHKRTFLILGQWSDMDDAADEVFAAIRSSLRLPQE